MSRNRLAAQILARVRTGKLTEVVLCLGVFCTFPSVSHAQVPVYEVTPVESTIKFGVDSSVPIKGTFDKWTASMNTHRRPVGRLARSRARRLNHERRRRIRKCPDVRAAPAPRKVISVPRSHRVRRPARRCPRTRAVRRRHNRRLDARRDRQSRRNRARGGSCARAGRPATRRRRRQSCRAGRLRRAPPRRDLDRVSRNRGVALVRLTSESRTRCPACGRSDKRAHVQSRACAWRAACNAPRA